MELAGTVNHLSITGQSAIDKMISGNCVVPDDLKSRAGYNPRQPGETCFDYQLRLRGIKKEDHDILLAAAKDLDNGMSYAEVSIKYGRTIYPEPGGQGWKIVGGIVTGLIAGGPIGAALGAAAAIAGNEAANKSSKDSVKKTTEDLKSLGVTADTFKFMNKTSGTNTTTNEGLQASFPTLKLFGKEISSLYLVIGAVILSIVFLMIKKR